MKYNLYIVLCVAIQLLICGNTNAATYEKISDTIIGVTETIEKVEQFTIQQIKAEINACNIDIGQAQDEINKLTEKITYYNGLLADAEALGVKEPVIIEPKEEFPTPLVIEESTELDNG